jgi:hypothetical protein
VSDDPRHAAAREAFLTDRQRPFPAGIRARENGSNWLVSTVKTGGINASEEDGGSTGREPLSTPHLSVLHADSSHHTWLTERPVDGPSALSTDTPNEAA